MIKKKICFDIDGVICNSNSNDYKKSRPIKKNVNLINKLHSKNYEIILYTARFMGRSNEDKKLAEKKAKKLTLNQLKVWGVKFHKINFGKPSFDILIDDKTLGFNKSWNKYLIQKLKND